MYICSDRTPPNGLRSVATPCFATLLNLLETEYPSSGRPGVETDWSYSLLAIALRTLGAPAKDLRELWRRMVFNALVGNNDDHPRNHAAIYRPEEKRWRLSPAFDIVPEQGYLPTNLSMQITTGSSAINMANLLANPVIFGFEDREHNKREFHEFCEKFIFALSACLCSFPEGSQADLAERFKQQVISMTE
ncbi:HipA domain-containing protein [Chitinimonas arctica]|uniref:HipA domain-containing protein n=1 Tax=Chitinimonas arctica TaxID=2594795 RepID=A0A516SG70_9NEIS|nr:HipA domain-containing protein [Chitinimonas arctica]QDQ27018.1 HipA domain-containing protein [Chitinimonas arctica]